MSDEVQDSIRDTVAANEVVLFMKGTKSMPQCGFSSRVAGVLNYLDVEFKDVNVLEDEGIREGIKVFLRLAHNSSTLHQGRVRRRMRHHHGDDADRRIGRLA